MDVSMVDPGDRDAVDQGDGMREADEMAAMIRLHRLGWGVRRIAAEIGCSHMTVRRYLAAGGPVAYCAPERSSVRVPCSSGRGFRDIRSPRPRSRPASLGDRVAE